MLHYKFEKYVVTLDRHVTVYFGEFRKLTAIAILHGIFLMPAILFL